MISLVQTGRERLLGPPCLLGWVHRAYIITLWRGTICEWSDPNAMDNVEHKRKSARRLSHSSMWRARATRRNAHTVKKCVSTVCKWFLCVCVYVAATSVYYPSLQVRKIKLRKQNPGSTPPPPYVVIIHVGWWYNENSLVWGQALLFGSDRWLDMLKSHVTHNKNLT